MNNRTHVNLCLVALLLLVLSWQTSYGQNNVGIGTTSPDSALSIYDQLEIGGSEGDLVFRNTSGSITFPQVTPADLTSPMIHLFSGGTSNADRMVIAHSSTNPDWGLMYRDNVDQFRFGVASSNSAVSIGVGLGHLAVGETDVSSQSLLIAASSNDVTTGHFINTNTSSQSVNGVYSSVSGSGSGDKRAGFFESLLGAGRAFGVYATSALADTNIAIYGSAGFFGGQTDDLNRAAWFDDGDVIVDEQMLVGSASITDIPDASAILELNSSDKGLLLPRMTASQRTSILAPAEGLLVYDLDSANVFLHRAGSWKGLTGGGGGGTLWSADASPPGVYLSDGQVGVGNEPQFFRRFYLESKPNLPYAMDVLNNYDGGLGKYGLRIETSSLGTNNRYGIYAKTWAPNNSNIAYGIYTEANQYSSAATVYGIYATAPGTGTGERWAGYFEGNAKVTEDLVVDGDHIKILPTGFNSAGEIRMYDNDGTPTVMIRANQSTSQGAEILMADEEGVITLEIDSDNSTQSGGVIAIRDESGNNRIRLEGKSTNTQGSLIEMFNESDVKTIEIDAEEGDGRGSCISLTNHVAQTTIEIDADYANSGDGRVITDELEIKGGSDLAEYFSSSEASTPLEPGQVVVIDPENPGQVALSRVANDRKVIGIVSGANGIKPGMMMGQKGTIAYGDVPIAIAGRVYVKVDASQGNIQPGDFLTSSDSPGCAQRVRKINKSQGAILGKALTFVDEKGYVLMLVQLQ